MPLDNLLANSLDQLPHQDDSHLITPLPVDPPPDISSMDFSVGFEDPAVSIQSELFGPFGDQQVEPYNSLDTMSSTTDLYSGTTQQLEWLVNLTEDPCQSLLQEPWPASDSIPAQELYLEAPSASISIRQDSTPGSSSSNQDSSSERSISQGAYCGECAINVKSLSSHRRKHRPRRFACTEPGCTKQFHLKTDLHRHTRCVHLKLQLSCPHCGTKITGRKENLRRHIKNKGCGGL
ncbi:hypothetical protein V8F06_010365 [Rhypophila decipiens]